MTSAPLTSPIQPIKPATIAWLALVTQMLDLNKRLQDAKLEHERTLFQQQIAATDAAIDALVYELYGLTGEEIRIVEGKSVAGPLKFKITYSSRY